MVSSLEKNHNIPYEWAKPSGSGDNYLRNMKPGTYNLKCKIKDKCGKYHEIYAKFYVKGNDNHGQCAYKAWFKYPQNGDYYNEGHDVYVKLDAQHYNHIKYVELFINGKFIRKESSYPYEWAKNGSNGDSYLRNLKHGTYKLKARVYDHCGKSQDFYTTFHVKGHNGENTECDYKAWFKYPQNGKYIQGGSDVYVYLDAQNYNYIKYVELYINGKMIRKESQYPYEWAKGDGSEDGYLRNLKPGTYKLQARVYDNCDGYKDYYCTFYVKGGNDQGGHQDECENKSWFKYPQNNSTHSYGDDVYVRVDTKKYQDIKEMNLYVNGKFVRKESAYPYEWAKPNQSGDTYLRNLKRGTYNLKCRVKTNCGEWHEYFCKFYVR